MKRSIRSPRLLLLFALMGLFGAGYALQIFLQPTETLEQPAETKAPPAQFSEEYWAGRIDEVGGVRAWREFAQEEEQDPQGHTYGHFFGRLLYKKAGMQGIAACDSALNFSCFHEVMAETIAEHGIGAVATLSPQCSSLDSWGSQVCWHGIGHGVLSFLGYDFASLVESLGICVKAEEVDNGGCSGGALMEYTFQTMLDDKGQVRTFHAEDPYAPCSQLPQKHHQACYYWQPLWWGRVLEGEMPHRYDVMGSFCAQLPAQLERESCYRGIGNMTGPFSNWDVLYARALCERLGSGGETRCRQDAAGSFRVQSPETRAVALSLCEGLPETDRGLCAWNAGDTR